MLHPLVLVAMLIAIALILGLPRKYVIAPFLLMAFLVPLSQQIVLGGVHVLVLRIVIVAGLARMLFGKQRVLAGGWNSMDSVFLMWALFRAIAFILLNRDMGAVVNQVGFLWDSLGAFFVLRFLIRDDGDIQRLVKVLCVIAGFVAVCMLNEHFRQVNIFGFLGSGRTVPEIRDGSVRAQGPFAHALLAGTFGGILVPLFVSLWITSKSKVLAVVGIVSSTVITFMSASSTPILAYVASVVGLCCWPIRSRMRMVRWAIVIALVGLNMVMKAPVWFLIAHIDVVGGSSADHRAHLVDLFIRNFGDWWLVGTNAAASWGWDMWDTCNQYVQEGESGGLAAFLCFVGLIVLSFKKIGRARKAARGSSEREWFFWCLGAAMFANVTAFFGIAYFDQTTVMWYALLAMITVATLRKKRELPKTSGEEISSLQTEPEYAPTSLASSIG